ncbi:MAG: DUF4349 domain-containing protein [Polyangiaceae bacterium]
MKRWGAVFGLTTMMLVSACSKESEPSALELTRAPAMAMASTSAVSRGAPSQAGAASGAVESAADDVAPMARKIVRNADLGIVASDPSEAERAATSIANDLGGHVARSDRSESEAAQGTEERSLLVNMELRVPSDRFAEAVLQLGKLGTRITEQRVYSNDVTEAFMDVRAHLVAERALETQFLQILKQAQSVKDALEVSRSLADVRASIEKLEAQLRLLENQTSMSTIKLSIVHAAPLAKVGRLAFVDSVKRAGGDFVDVSAAIVHGSIRAVGLSAPVAIFVLLPLAFLRVLVRRRRAAALRA